MLPGASFANISIVDPVVRNIMLDWHVYRVKI